MVDTNYIVTETGDRIVTETGDLLVWVGTATGPPPGPDPPTTPISIPVLDSLQILDGYVPVRADTFEFELLDRYGASMGTLNVASDTPPTLRFDTTRTTARTVSNLTVYSVDLAAIDVEHERLSLAMRLQNGDKFPLGVVMFGQDNQAPSSWGIKQTPELFDEMFLIDQDLDITVSLPVGGSVYDAITILLAPFPSLTRSSGNLVIEAPDAPAIAPSMWKVGSSRYAALKDCAALLGCFPPFFDNDRVMRFKVPRSPGDPTTDHLYTKGLRIIEDGVTLQNSAYKAPNRYIVVGAGVDGPPPVGIYDLPASAPHSAAKRNGRIVTSTDTSLTSIASAQAAAQAAYVNALTDRTAYGKISFAATADPRHDGYDRMEVLGVHYLETAWELEMTSGGEHKHEGTQLWPVG